MRIRAFLFTWLLSLALPGALRAQEALVLSGGGSKGLAHAGVLEGLRELGYDPDMVVGTSMGALVGALYAAGYTPEEVQRRIREVDWNQIFSATPTIVGPQREVRFPLVALDLDVARLRVSRGLLGQWRINRALTRLLFDAEARSRGDFDRLARRYRAVAADLETGDTVVLASGDLARAARASMAVPGFFAPVQWGDRVLVDGGIANNLPTDVARQLGAARIIAVDVGRPPARIHSLAPLSVIGRAIDLMQENTQRDTVAADELILPALDPAFSGTSFPADPAPLFAVGLAAARRDLPRAPPRVGRGERPLPLPPDSFSAVFIEAPDSALAALGRHVFAQLAPGAYDVAAVQVAIDRLYSTALFEGVWPRVEERVDGKPRIVVRLDGPPKLSLSAAAHYDNDRGARGWVTLDRFTSVRRRPAVLSASTAIGGLDRWGTLSLRVQPITLPELTWSAGAHMRDRGVRFFPEDALGTTQVLRVGGFVALERPHVLRNRLATLALRGEWIKPEAAAGGTALGPLLRYASVDPDVRLVGVPLLLEVERRWGSFTYTRAAFAASRSLSTRAGFAIAPLIDLRAASKTAPSDDLPSLGEAGGMPGLRWGEEPGHARAVAGIDAAQPLLGGHVRLRLRVGGVSAAWDRWQDSRWHAGASLGGLWRSPVGAVEAGFGMTTRGDGRFDLSIGRPY